MIRDVIYGTKGEKPGFGQFVELFMFEEDNHLGIDWTNDGHATIFHFLIKDKNDYEDFKNELIAVLRDCKDIGEAYYELEAYLNSEYVDDFLEEYCEGDDVMNESESRPITVEEYLKARDLMVAERNFVWTAYEELDFESDKLVELIEAYDLVIDSLTCLAMKVDKKNKK